MQVTSGTIARDDAHVSGPTPQSLEELLRSNRDPERVHREVENASDDTLLKFGLRAYRMNLTALFGDTWEPSRIADTARAATRSKMLGGWEYHHQYLPALAGKPDEPVVTHVPIELIEDVQAKGRGAILMTFHIGHMRYLSSDIAHAGIDIAVPLAGDSFADYASAKTANPNAVLWNTFHFHNVEIAGGAIALARVLAKGGCIFSTIDGNTGLDGTQGKQQRVEVQVLGVPAKVKVGLFALSARFGAPIIIMAAHNDGGRKTCTVGPCFDPGTKLKGSKKQSYIDASAQSAYSFFGEMLERHADEWCGGDLFHQWRLPKAVPGRDQDEAEALLSRALSSGGRLAMNPRRIVPLHSGIDLVWSDAKTGSCFKLPSQMTELVERLADPGVGIDRSWLDDQPSTVRAEMWRLMCSLAMRDAVVEVSACRPVQSEKEVVPTV